MVIVYHLPLEASAVLQAQSSHCPCPTKLLQLQGFSATPTRPLTGASTLRTPRRSTRSMTAVLEFIWTVRDLRFLLPRLLSDGGLAVRWLSLSIGYCIWHHARCLVAIRTGLVLPIKTVRRKSTPSLEFVLNSSMRLWEWELSRSYSAVRIQFWPNGS